MKCYKKSPHEPELGLSLTVPTLQNLVARTLLCWKHADDKRNFEKILILNSPLHSGTIRVLLNTTLAETLKDLSRDHD